MIITALFMNQYRVYTQPHKAGILTCNIIWTGPKEKIEAGVYILHEIFFLGCKMFYLSPPPPQFLTLKGAKGEKISTLYIVNFFLPLPHILRVFSHKGGMEMFRTHFPPSHIFFIPPTPIAGDPMQNIHPWIEDIHIYL